MSDLESSVNFRRFRRHQLVRMADSVVESPVRIRSGSGPELLRSPSRARVPDPDCAWIRSESGSRSLLDPVRASADPGGGERCRCVLCLRRRTASRPERLLFQQTPLSPATHETTPRQLVSPAQGRIHDSLSPSHWNGSVVSHGTGRDESDAAKWMFASPF